MLFFAKSDLSRGAGSLPVSEDIYEEFKEFDDKL
jgi:hypothetical protein